MSKLIRDWKADRVEIYLLELFFSSTELHLGAADNNIIQEKSYGKDYHKRLLTLEMESFLI